jgi:signal transduction histidine kinase
MLEEESIFDKNIQVMIKVAIFTVASFTILFFIMSYKNYTDILKSEIETEAFRIEKTFAEDVRYILNIVDIIEQNIIDEPSNFQNIDFILSQYKSNSTLGNTLGILNITYVTKDFESVINNNLSIIKDISLKNQYIELVRVFTLQDNKVLYVSDNHKDFFSKKRVLRFIKKILNFNGETLGFVIISSDVDVLKTRLSEKTIFDYTNFAILNEDLKIIFKFNCCNLNGPHYYLGFVQEKFKNINLLSQITEVDIFSGKSFYINRLNSVPFVLLVSFSPDILKATLFKKILYKFFEISMVSLICLMIIIFIYKREYYLRIRAQKALKVANNAISSKADYLSFTAHEIRSPLGFIITGSELILSGMIKNNPEKITEYIYGINKNAHIILDFIIEVLDDRNIINGNFKIVKNYFNINEIILSAISHNKARYHDRKISIITRFHSDNNFLLCDSKRMTQALNNIISNSIKYSDDNTEIVIFTYINNNQFVISIKDEGFGIEESDVSNIFSPNFRHKNFYKSKEISEEIESHGLGLVIVKQLIQNQDGEIRIESKVSVGTTVSILFNTSLLRQQDDLVTN